MGQNYAEAENVSMDDRISIGFPRMVDGMSGGDSAMMRDCVVIQDVFNDYKNAERSYYEKGWPSLWVDAEEIEFDAIIDQKAEPAAIRLKKKTNPATPLEDSFYREPDMQLPTSFVNEITNLSGPLIQFISGALPSLQGENDPDNKTASGKAMDRSQAMGMLGMPWANMQRLFARMYYQAALLAADNPDHAQSIVVPGDGSTNTTLALDKLKKGKFMAHADTDSSFPESTAAKRANMQQILTMMVQAPQIAVEFFADPDNWEEVLSLMGTPELKLNPAAAYKKQVFEIELLLRESPIPPDPIAMQQAAIQHAAQSIAGQQQGLPPQPFQPPPPQSSVPVEEEDFHQWEYMAKCKEWLSDEDCRREQAKGNMAGIQNVRLHAAQHKMFMQQEAMQQMAAQAAMQPAPPPGKAPAAHAPEANKETQNKSKPPGAPGQPTL